jgi:cyclase|tara:strand:- start:1524 stop:2273 length:750 start_codon:yes stop_codon:yes gene_type:complete
MRIVSRLDIKNDYLIKGLALEGLRKLGNAKDFAKKYYQFGIDEIIYIDTVASLYSREGIFKILMETVQEVFVPITVGGGIRTVNDAYKYFDHGADKIFINTAAVENPEIIDKLVNKFGSANITLSVETIKDQEGETWGVYTSNGRDKSNKELSEWILEATERGVGEIFITSVNFDGFQQGFDYELMSHILSISNLPVVLSGGFGQIKHLENLSQKLSGIAVGSSLHYGKIEILEIKDKLKSMNFEVRNE